MKKFTLLALLALCFTLSAAVIQGWDPMLALTDATAFASFQAANAQQPEGYDKELVQGCLDLYQPFVGKDSTTATYAEITTHYNSLQAPQFYWLQQLLRTPQFEAYFKDLIRDANFQDEELMTNFLKVMPLNSTGLSPQEYYDNAVKMMKQPGYLAKVTKDNWAFRQMIMVIRNDLVQELSDEKILLLLKMMKKFAYPNIGSSDTSWKDICVQIELIKNSLQ